MHCRFCVSVGCRHTNIFIYFYPIKSYFELLCHSNLRHLLTYLGSDYPPMTDLNRCNQIKHPKVDADLRAFSNAELPWLPILNTKRFGVTPHRCAQAPITSQHCGYTCAAAACIRGWARVVNLFSELCCDIFGLCRLASQLRDVISPDWESTARAVHPSVIHYKSAWKVGSTICFFMQ